MHFSYILLLVFVAFEISNAKVLQQVPDVTRQIHGSHGAFRDFTSQDCDQAHENSWTRCSGGESPAFVYHWNNRLRGCERALYKGCGSTRNNFITERDCNNQAKPVCTKK